jgi:hypothetical protein
MRRRGSLPAARTPGVSRIFPSLFDKYRNLVTVGKTAAT